MSCPVSLKKTTKMMSKCRKCHLRETKFAKFPGGACPQTPLEARAVGARLSAFGANRASLFLLKRGWNVCMYHVMFYNMGHVVLYNMCHVMLYNISYVMLYKMCHVMFCNIGHVVLYNMSHVVLYNMCHVMFYNISYVMLYNMCHVMLYSMSHFVL